ncbi:MAG: hypothetical protein ACYSVY_17855 [Planctomycetota bacterium]|jgi:hypothetical protein
MLSRLLIVRLKAAENALKDGRYDEAFRLATEPDIREHRRGGAVLRELTDCLLERARAHFKADRYAEALLDLTKAEAGGVKKEEIAELREQVRIVAEEELRKQNSRRLRLEAARRRIERGSLRGGERLLEEVSAADPDAQELQRHVEVRQQDAADALAEVERLIKQGELRRAAERLDRARSADPNAAQVAELEARISQEVVQRARASLEARRLQRAVDELNSLGTVGATRPERRELEQIIEQARRTGRALAENRFDDALQDVMRLQHLAPKLDWARQACNELKRLDELLLSLRAGPLGQCAEVGSVRVVVDGKTQGPDRPGVLDETVAVPQVFCCTGATGFRWAGRRRASRPTCPSSRTSRNVTRRSPAWKTTISCLPPATWRSAGGRRVISFCETATGWCWASGPSSPSVCRTARAAARFWR